VNLVVDGSIQWRFSTGKPIFSSPSLINRFDHELICFGCVDHSFYIISSQGEKVSFSFQLSSYFFLNAIFNFFFFSEQKGLGSEM